MKAELLVYNFSSFMHLRKDYIPAIALLMTFSYYFVFKVQNHLHLTRVTGTLSQSVIGKTLSKIEGMIQDNFAFTKRWQALIADIYSGGR